jgi:hypothetical protein
MSYTKLANKIFSEMIGGFPPELPQATVNNNEGIVTSTSEFIALVAEVIKAGKDLYQISDLDELIPVEQYPRDLLWKVNNGQEAITTESKKQLTIVTYTADETPAQLSAHSPFHNTGIKNIKPRLIDIIPDEKYTGYSIARVGKVVEAVFDFMVWGLEDKGIRDRASLLRKIIQNNIWFLKHKGLREIVWTGATEKDVMDKQNIVKYKKESYRIVFTEIQEIREKNVEQILVQVGPSW